MKEEITEENYEDMLRTHSDPENLTNKDWGCTMASGDLYAFIHSRVEGESAQIAIRANDNGLELYRLLNTRFDKLT